jgi:cytochrome P450
LPTVFRNYIEAIPRSAYDEGVTTFGRVRNDVVLLTKPELIAEVLVERPEAFRRDPVTRRAFAPAIGGNSLFLAEDADWRTSAAFVPPRPSSSTIFNVERCGLPQSNHFLMIIGKHSYETIV